jgi:uncharacterized membrane protein
MIEQTVTLTARAIEALGALVIGWAMVRASVTGAAGRFDNAALGAMRRELAHRALSALGLVTAATLIKTITLRSWGAIGLFAAVLALRTLLKLALTAEERSAEPREGC